MKKSVFPYPTQNYSRKIKWVTHIGVALLIGVIAMWGFIYTIQKRSETNGIWVKKVLAVENKKVSHYSPPPIKIKKYVTINVINSTGKTKHEGKIVKALVKSGYSHSNIELGNTKVVGDIGTTITANADFEEIVANIKDVLKSVTPEITDGIPNNDPNVDSGFDVVIVTRSR